MADVRVGTSGWSYPAWVGSFYPEGTSPARMLRIYGSVFSTVEAHATFRRLPSEKALLGWVGAVPPEFRFAPKAHLAITHRRDLEGVEDRMAAFLTALAPLGDRLGPVLLSLPHQHPDLGRLDRLLAALAGGPPAAFDLGPAWDVPAVLDRLDAAGATLVVTDDGNRSPGAIPSVGPVAYVRLRRGSYTSADLDRWGERLAKVGSDARDAYVFLKHDDAGTGPALGAQLLERLG